MKLNISDAQSKYHGTQVYRHSSTHLALDHGLNDDHLGGAMHFLNLAGYGMSDARIEPHQIPLGPVHGSISFGSKRYISINIYIYTHAICRRTCSCCLFQSNYSPIIKIRCFWFYFSASSSALLREGETGAGKIFKPRADALLQK